MAGQTLPGRSLMTQLPRLPGSGSVGWFCDADRGAVVTESGGQDEWAGPGGQGDDDRREVAGGVGLEQERLPVEDRQPDLGPALVVTGPGVSIITQGDDLAGFGCFAASELIFRVNPRTAGS
jgi:hypothetical protein